MKRIKWIMCLGLTIFLSVPLLVLAEDREVGNSEGVIVYLEGLPTDEAKSQFLLHYGQIFLQEKKYEDAQEVAQYVLDHYDGQSTEAKGLVEEAKQRGELEMPQINPVTFPPDVKNPERKTSPMENTPEGHEDN